MKVKDDGGIHGGMNIHEDGHRARSEGLRRKARRHGASTGGEENPITAG
jgi:hypothetical protein